MPHAHSELKHQLETFSVTLIRRIHNHNLGYAVLDLSMIHHIDKNEYDISSVKSDMTYPIGYALLDI